jgi:tetratricopeptide (TPR) repeat protein
MILRAQSKWPIMLTSAWFTLPAWSAEPSSAGSADAPVAAATATGTPASTAHTASAGSVKLDPKGKTGMSPHTVKILEGHAAYLARDLNGAIAAYKEAISADAAEPSAYYFLGQAELAAGHAAEADASFQKGLKSRGAKDKKAAADDEWQTKLLFVVADLREREGRFADAKKAWEECRQFATAHAPTTAAATTASERIRAIDNHLDLETKYAAVKQRIEQRLRETGSPPPDKGPRAPTPPTKPGAR